MEEPGPDNDMTDAEYEKQMREWEELSLDEIPVYEFDPDAANDLLNSAGWNLNAEGGAYQPGEGNIRCSLQDGKVVQVERNEKTRLK